MKTVMQDQVALIINLSALQQNITLSFNLLLHSSFYFDLFQHGLIIFIIIIIIIIIVNFFKVGAKSNGEITAN